MIAQVGTSLDLLAENAMLRAELARAQKLAAYDCLTELLNRREFNLILESEWGRAERHQTPLALILIDVDFFKEINTDRGHGGGDQALVEIASVIKDNARRVSDMGFRLGGDEFAVLLPAALIDGAVDVAQQICSEVKALGYSVSIGVSGIVPCIGGTAEEFVRLADDALFEAKALGRNQVRAKKG